MINNNFKIKNKNYKMEKMYINMTDLCLVQ